MDEEEQTFDDGEAAFLAPRLATFADDSHVDDTAADIDLDGVNDINDTLLGYDLTPSNAPHAGLFSNDNEEAEDASVSAAQALEMFLHNGEDDVSESEIDDDANGPLAIDLDMDEEADDGDDDGGGGVRGEAPRAGGANTLAVFPLSRVKELLKFHSSSSIIARDAAVTASEAVRLILNDMARLAADEAQRHRRKTVTYADVSRIVQLMDRFSFLTDIIPPLPSAPSAAKVVVGPARAGTRPTAARTSNEKPKGTGLQQAKGGYPGSQMRQATLRF